MDIGFTNMNAADIAATYNLSDTQNLKNRLSKVESEDDEKMMQACKEFESYMLEQVYKQMEKTVMKEEESSNSYTAMFSDMRIQQYAKSAMDQGGVGLAQQLYESMKRQSMGIDPAELSKIQEQKELSEKQAAENAVAENSAVSVEEV